MKEPGIAAEVKSGLTFVFSVVVKLKGKENTCEFQPITIKAGRRVSRN